MMMTMMMLMLNNVLMLIMMRMMRTRCDAVDYKGNGRRDDNESLRCQ